jgi:multiple sugar transport system permease protein
VLAWGSLRGRALILSLVIALYVIPQESIIMPLVIMVSRAGITDTFTVQIVPWVASPLYIFLFYQFFAQLPKELFEAAEMDGASVFRIYRSIFLPLSLPALATVSILMGIESWNQYLWPILVTQTDYARPISVAIATFFGQDSIYWDRAMAASVLMMIPILALYLAFQRWFVSSFVGSAVKG